MINNKNSWAILFVLWSLVSSSSFADGRIQVLGLFKNQAIILYHGERLRLMVNGPAKQGIKLVSADSDQAVLDIDGTTRAFKLGSASSFKLAKPVAATVKIAADRMGMYGIKGSINGHFVEFLVDTGATMVAINSVKAHRLGIDFKAGKLTSVSTAAGVVPAYLVPLRRVKIGAIELHDVEAAVLVGDHPSVALLGMSFLQRLKMENSGKTLTLIKPY